MPTNTDTGDGDTDELSKLLPELDSTKLVLVKNYIDQAVTRHTLAVLEEIDQKVIGENDFTDTPMHVNMDWINWRNKLRAEQRTALETIKKRYEEKI